MWPDTTLCQRLGIDHPIIQAPMASASNPAFVAAVSNAGGLGSFGAAFTPPGQLRETVRQIKGLTNRPFHINLFSMPLNPPAGPVVPGPQLLTTIEKFHRELNLGEIPEPSLGFQPADEQLEVLIDEQVPVISFHFGVDPVLVERAKSSGATVLCSATTVDEAKFLESAGVDLVIAQGAEAGGHRGTFSDDSRLPLIGSLALIPQIVDAVSLPVVAAGGIMEARGIVASMALGAVGVQMGTAFLGCEEAPISPAWKEALVNATDADAVVTHAISGRPARGVRNRILDELEALDEAPLPYPAQYSVSAILRTAAAKLGHDEFLALWCGQGVGMIQQISAADLVDQLVKDCRKLLTKLAVAD